MAQPKLGNSSKIISITPKLYIQDDGTDYTSGESYNGLLAGGTTAVPTGYGAGGHWKITESEGNILYNNRTRGSNDLYMRGFNRSTDATGTYVQFSLPGNLPIAAASPSNYMMIGADPAKASSSNVETTGFDAWLKNPGFESAFQMTDGGSPSKANIRFMFDFWAHFRKGPVSNGDIQTYLFLMNVDSSSNYDKVLRFGMYNDSGSPRLRVWYADDPAASRTAFNDLCSSTTAGEAIYPSGLAAEGGLHHIALVFDRTNFINFGTTNGPDGFYVDGKYHACNVFAGVNNAAWETNPIEVNVNPLIGCEIEGDNEAWTAPKISGHPKFLNHFTGKIYHSSLSPIVTAGELTQARMRTLNSLKFNIPRNPTKVDFSDRYEYKGRNLLQALSTLNQKIETEKGTFTISVSSIKVKN